MRITLPASWDELTQGQLRTVLRLYVALADHEDGMRLVKVAAWAAFCRISVLSRTDAGWLCRLRQSDEYFILDPELLPDIISRLDFLDQPGQMTVRLESEDGHTAARSDYGDVTFGTYLTLENYYQAFLRTHDEENLRRMTAILYGMTREETAGAEEELLLGSFLWHGAVKGRLSAMFTHFFRPAAGNAAGTEEEQREAVNAQIRLLTKGDITKTDMVIKANLRTALAELDALAREAEETRRIYGKNNV